MMTNSKIYPTSSSGEKMTPNGLLQGKLRVNCLGHLKSVSRKPRCKKIRLVLMKNIHLQLHKIECFLKCAQGTWKETRRVAGTDLLSMELVRLKMRKLLRLWIHGTREWDKMQILYLLKKMKTFAKRNKNVFNNKKLLFFWKRPLKEKDQNNQPNPDLTNSKN